MRSSFDACWSRPELAPRNNAKLAAALVRISLDDELRDNVTSRR
jgi:hypothetical protein